MPKKSKRKPPPKAKPVREKRELPLADIPQVLDNRSYAKSHPWDPFKRGR